MSDTIVRREALRRLFIVSAGAALAACSHKPNCSDVSALTPDEQKARSDVAGYTENAPDPSKKCASCVQFVAGPENGCASCKVVKGPISPDGTCKLFVAKG